MYAIPKTAFISPTPARERLTLFYWHYRPRSWESFIRRHDCWDCIVWVLSRNPREAETSIQTVRDGLIPLGRCPR